MLKDFKDVTFLYVFHPDSVERMENLLLSINYITDRFETNIHVLEVGAYSMGILPQLLSEKICYHFVCNPDSIFYRTKYLNQMLNNSTTKYVAVVDCDIIVPEEQLEEAMHKLRSENIQVVYPFSNFYDTSIVFRTLYIRTNNVEILNKHTACMNELYSPGPTGGIFICSLEAYKEIGCENENFYGWGVEDGERYARWKNSRFSMHRIDGPLFHLTHPRFINSRIHSLAQSAIKKRILNQTKYSDNTYE